MSAVEYTHAFHSETLKDAHDSARKKQGRKGIAYVVSCVRVIIHTTKESRGRVLAYELDKEMSTAWVLIHER